MRDTSRENFNSRNSADYYIGESGVEPTEDNIDELKKVIKQLEEHKSDLQKEIYNDISVYKAAVETDDKITINNYKRYLEQEYKDLQNDIDMIDYINSVLEEKIKEAETY